MYLFPPDKNVSFSTRMLRFPIIYVQMKAGPGEPVSWRSGSGFPWLSFTGTGITLRPFFFSLSFFIYIYIYNILEERDSLSFGFYLRNTVIHRKYYTIQNIFVHSKQILIMFFGVNGSLFDL